MQSIAASDDKAPIFSYQWDAGNLLQTTTVTITYSKRGGAYIIDSSDQINVECDNCFFKQTGSAVNIIDSTVYIQVAGYRRTLFVKGGADQFGFAIKVID